GDISEEVVEKVAVEVETVLRTDGEIVGVADLETAGLIEAGYRPFAIGIGRILRQNITEATAVRSGVGVRTVVEGLRPGVVSEHRESVAKALVDAQIQTVVLHASA